MQINRNTLKAVSESIALFFIFLVIMVYMPIVPIMEVFGLIYFAGHYLVHKHQCMHVYAQQFEGGGEATWQRLFPFLMACLYMGEVVFIAYMGLKKAPIQGGLGFIPLIITVLFHMHLNRTVVKPLRNLSYEVATDVDIEDGELDRQNFSVLYGMPSLNTDDEERGPMHYRRDGDEETALGKSPIDAPKSDDTDAEKSADRVDSSEPGQRFV